MVSRELAEKVKFNRYTIACRMMLKDGEEFACDVLKLTLAHAAILTETSIAVGEPIWLYVDSVGLLHGRVGRCLPQGVIVNIDINESRERKISARIAWHEQRAAAFNEQRSSPRIVPTKRDVKIWITKELSINGQVIDLSLSGAAIKLPEGKEPFVGSVVKIGRRSSTVVRHLENGIAAQFEYPLSSATFGPDISL